MKTMLTALLILGACGGGAKKQDTAPVDHTSAAKPDDSDGNMVAPDTADEIRRLFDRKRPAVSRCLSMAIDSKELPKSSRGKVTLAVTISRAGRAEEVKVIKASLESKSLEDCVIGKVQEIQFPEVPSPYPTTYTYAFEAM